MGIIIGVFACFGINGVSAHGDNCRCGASNVVCRKHQWMLIGMLGIFLTYIYMYGEYIWRRYLSEYVARWFMPRVKVTNTCEPGCRCHRHKSHSSSVRASENFFKSSGR